MATASLRKLRKNAEKYPADKVRGKSDKYTKYNEGKTDDVRRLETENCERPKDLAGQGKNASSVDDVKRLRGGQTEALALSINDKPNHAIVIAGAVLVWLLVYLAVGH